MNLPPALSSASNLVFNFSDCRLKERLSARVSASYGRWLGGFRTLELRSGPVRQGFAVEALGGGRAVLASKSMVSATAFNKYGVDPAVLEDLALPALEAAVSEGRIVLLDELGPMSLLSDKFSARVTDLLFSPAPCLVFYRRGAALFEDAFRKMTDTVIMELSPGGWAGAVAAAEAWLDRKMRDMENRK